MNPLSNADYPNQPYYSHQPLNQYLPPSSNEFPYSDGNPLLDNQNNQLRVFSYPFVADQTSFQRQVTTQPTTLLAQQTLGLPTRTKTSCCIQKPHKKLKQSIETNLKSKKLNFFNFTTIDFQKMNSREISISNEPLTLTNFSELTHRSKNLGNRHLKCRVNKQVKEKLNSLNQKVDKQKKETTHTLENDVKELTRQARLLYQMYLPGQSIDLDLQLLTHEIVYNDTLETNNFVQTLQDVPCEEQKVSIKQFGETMSQRWLERETSNISLS